MDGDGMHVRGMPLYGGCYLEPHRKMLLIMASGMCCMTFALLCTVIYSYGSF